MSAKPDFSESLDFDELLAEIEQEHERIESGTKLKIVQFTDPLCGWCYGMEPVMTKLRYQLGDQLDFSYVLGLVVAGLVFHEHIPAIRYVGVALIIAGAILIVQK